MEPLSQEELTNSIQTFKMRIMFCIHKYVEDIINTYNACRKPGRPVMTYEWLRGFILKELIIAIKSGNYRLWGKKNFIDLLVEQHYKTERHVKTGENYDIYLTVVHILKSHRSDSNRHDDLNLLNDVSNLINNLNGNHEIQY